MSRSALDDELDELFAQHRTEIVGLKADLAEARAQIAAKDAALRACRDAIERSYSFTDWSPIVERINAALTAPARETE